VKSKLAAVFEAETPAQLARLYDELAPLYDKELDSDVGPQHATETFSRHVPREAKTLDAGCGTGRVGQLLHDLGYSDLEGLDLSPGMLAEARKRGCYVALHRQALGDRLDFPDESFDAVVSVGVFVRGHARSCALNELVRVVKPRGYIVFTLRPEFYAKSDFPSTMTSLADARRWHWVETTAPFNAGYREFPEVNLQVWVFRVLASPSPRG
jgi:ubiquinone/menaquinone biosynthesis C-methylase UbiE